ncbi:MAG: alpha/beta hydrolase [Flavitalea sp.]
MKKAIEVEGHSLSYVEANETCYATIFFLHGNSGSVATWNAQFNDPALQNYRLVAFDLPGHGDSRMAGLAANVFNVIEMGRIVKQAIIILSSDRPFIVAGLSLGTNLIGEMQDDLFAPSGLILLSPSIVGDSIAPADLVKEGASGIVLYTDNPSETLVQQYLQETIFMRNPGIYRQILRDYHMVHKKFRSVLASSIPATLYSDEVANLAKYPFPLLVIVGADDQITDPDLLNRTKLNFWRGSIFSIKDAGHLVCMDKPEATSVLIADYAQERFKTAGA